MTDVLQRQDTTLASLFEVQEPSLWYWIRKDIHGEAVDTPDLAAIQKAIKKSKRVATLLSECDSNGMIPHHPYHKWIGAHWVLASLADLGYPAGDSALNPLADQVIGWLFGKERHESVAKRTKQAGGYPTRACGSMEGNALLSLVKLGIRKEAWPVLAQTLLEWQWPDGGWNCDVTPSAHHSSFMETLLPMRALWFYGTVTGDVDAKTAAVRASEIFLKRELFLRQSDSAVMNSQYIQLHYPLYWHYDILGALWAMKEMDRLDDPRCEKALNLLRTKQLSDGGFPAEGRYYHHRSGVSNASLVDWGTVSKVKLNPWITVRAFAVLSSAI